jgi:hypothetical protein
LESRTGPFTVSKCNLKVLLSLYTVWVLYFYIFEWWAWNSLAPIFPQHMCQMFYKNPICQWWLLSQPCPNFLHECYTANAALYSYHIYPVECYTANAVLYNYRIYPSKCPWHFRNLKKRSRERMTIELYFEIFKILTEKCF